MTCPALADAVGTPFYCYSTATLERHYRVFTEAFAGEKALVCYAMKANSNQSVLRTLAKLGAGADVVSGGELKRALAAGIPPSKILFSGVGKTEAELRAALAADILCINVESEPELELLSRLAVEAGKTARISVRVNPDVDAGTHAKISTGKSENKFGIPIARAREVYARAAKLPGIEVTGVDMHIGSQITDLGTMETAFRDARRIRRRRCAPTATPSRTSISAAASAFPITWIARRRRRPTPMPRWSSASTHNLGCTLMFEPGRHDRRQCRHPGHPRDLCEARRRQEFRHHRRRDERPDPADALRGASRHPAGARGRDGRARRSSPTWSARSAKPATISRSTARCPNRRPAISSPIMTAGAYGAVQSGTYNTRPLVPEVLVKDDQYAVVRPRLDVEALIAMDKPAPWL